MPSGDEHRDDLLRFARRVYQLILSWQAAKPHDTFKIDPKLSRLLALVPEYDSGRVRKAATARGAAKAPSIFTAQELADRLGAPICALFPSKDHRTFSDAQTEQIVAWLRKLASFISGATALPVDDFDDAVPFETLEKDVWDFAAGRDRIDDDFTPEPHKVFRGIAGIDSDRRQVIRVTSDSMSPLLLVGDRVLIDRAHKIPHEGEVVGVVSEEHGRIIGYWHVEERRCFLKKENRDHRTIDLGNPESWRVVGTVISFVDAPLRPNDRLRR
jgi:phage repressor protein C with HTH and peptisase S24 domain